MNKHFNQVRDFHESFGHEQADVPTEIDRKTALNRSIWTAEELVEFLYATVGEDLNDFNKIVGEFKKGIDDATVDTIAKKPDISNKLVAQMDALTDVSYFNYGTFAMANVDPEPLFDIVQDANMGKLWADGKPRYRKEDGKIQKPPHWEEEFAPEPKLKAEIERQSNQ